MRCSLSRPASGAGDPGKSCASWLSVAAQTRRLLSSLDIAIAFGSAAVTFLVLWPYLYGQYPNQNPFYGDEVTVAYVARRMLTEVPHRDFFDFKGFVGVLPQWAAFKLGPLSLTNARLAVFVWMSVASALAFIAAKLSTGRRMPGVLAALSPASISFALFPYAYQQHVAPLLAFAASAAALIAWKHTEVRWVSVAGACCALGLWASSVMFVPITFGMGLAVALSWRLAKKTALRATMAFGVGWLAVQLAIAAYFGAQGALGAVYQDMVEFPMLQYSGENRVAYADGAQYREAQVRGLPWDVRAASAGLGRANLAFVFLGCGLSLVTGLSLAFAWFRQEALQRPPPEWTSNLLGHLAPAAALGAASVPTLTGVMRPDIIHMGFSLPASALAGFCVLFAEYPFRRARILRGAVGAAACLALSVSLYFHLSNVLRIPSASFGDLDERIANECQLDLMELAVPAGDTVVAMPGAGPILLLDRKNASPINAYFAGSATPPSHWERTARAIVEQEPALLLADRSQFEKISRLQPKISTMYQGAPGLYRRARDLRDAAPLTGTWKYSLRNADGKPMGSGQLYIPKQAGKRLRVRMNFGGKTANVQGSLAGQQLVLLPPNQKLVATLSEDGSRLSGYGGNLWDCRVRVPWRTGQFSFEAQRLPPRPATPGP